MSSHVVHLPGSERARPALGLAARLVDALLSGLERASHRRTLAQLDDRALKDVGLTRGQIEAEAGKPFWLP